MHLAHRKYCEGVASGLTGTAAYMAAYPQASRGTAKGQSRRLLRKPEIRSEIERLRRQAEEIAGPAVLTLAEKRSFLARIVRARPALLEPDSDLWQSVKETKAGMEYRLPDKIAAIKEDNDLAGDGAMAAGHDELAALLARIVG